jgi:hypothetical protein
MNFMEKLVVCGLAVLSFIVYVSHIKTSKSLRLVRMFYLSVANSLSVWSLFQEYSFMQQSVYFGRKFNATLEHSTYMQTYIHAYTNACLHACIRTYMHTHMHAYIHTYIQRYFSFEKCPRTHEWPKILLERGGVMLGKKKLRSAVDACVLLRKLPERRSVTKIPLHTYISSANPDL